MASAIGIALCADATGQVLTPEQRADPGTGQIPNPSPIAQEYYIGTTSLGTSTTGFIVGAVYPDKGSLSWYKFTSDGTSPIIFDTYGTNMGFGGGFGASNFGELAVYDTQGHYIAGNEGSSTPASGDSNVNPLVPPGAPQPPVKYRQPINPTKPVYEYSGSAWFARNYQGLANLAFVKQPQSNPLWNPSDPNYTPNANWNQFPIPPAGTYFLAVTGYSTYFSGFARDASTIDDPSNATYTNGITSMTPFGFLTFHAMSGTYQLNERLAGDFDLDQSITSNDRRLLRLQTAAFKPTLGIPNQGFLNGDPSTGTWVGLPNNPSDPQTDLQRYDLTGNQRVDQFDLAAWGRYTNNPTSVSLTWNNAAPAPGLDPLNPGVAGDGATWDQTLSQNFKDASGSEVYFDGDTVTFNDNNNGNYLVQLNETVAPARVIVNSVGTYSITGSGGISGIGGLTKSGSGALILGTSNTFTGDTTVSFGTLLLTGALGSINATVNSATGHLVVNSTAALSANTNLTVIGGTASIAPAAGTGIRARALNSIIVNGGGSAALAAAANSSQRMILTLGSLTISGGKMDLGNNDLIVNGTAVGTIASYVASAFNNGSWDGNGLTSSNAQGDAVSTHKTAIGFASASSIGVSSFDGQAVGGSSVLVRFTYTGDANLDGIVNALDFNSLAAHYSAASGAQWFAGDFNYDGSVNSLDFAALASNFNLALAAGPSLSMGTIVPEPAFAATVAALGLMQRRGKRTDSVFNPSARAAGDRFIKAVKSGVATAQPPYEG